MKYRTMLTSLILVYSLIPTSYADNKDLLKNCPSLHALKIPSQKTSFIQKRYINGITKPLISKGTIHENELKQIEIETIEPEPYKLTFESDRMYISKKNSSGEYEKSLVEHEEAATLSQFLVSLLKEKNQEELEFLDTNYTLNCLANQNIHITGEIKDRENSSFVQTFFVRGKTKPSYIEIIDSDQNKIIIEIVSE